MYIKNPFKIFLSAAILFAVCSLGVHAETPPSAPAPEELPPVNMVDSFLKMMFTLGVIIVFLLVVSWATKKLMSKRLVQINSSSVIKIIDRRSLGPKSNVYLIRVREKEIVVGETPAGLSALSEMEAAVQTDEPLNEKGARLSFGQVMKRKLGKLS